MKSFKVVVLSLIILVCTSACQPAIPHNLPDREIIYQADFYGLGFVSADGQGNQVFEFKRQFTSPVWSADGLYLYGLARGKGLGGGYPAVWDLHKKRLKVCDWNQPNFEQIQSYQDSENPYMAVVYHTSAIIVFDIRTCQEKQFLVDYSGQAGDYALAGFSYSQDRQELVYGLVEDPYGDRQYRLMLKNLTTGEETQLAVGVNPSWSPDSSQIAFVGLDGLYVITLANHTPETTRLTNALLFEPWGSGASWSFITQPYWSPDGLWLVYHDYVSAENSKLEKVFIYKVHIHEGEPEAILEGGYYPSWHP